MDPPVGPPLYQDDTAVVYRFEFWMAALGFLCFHVAQRRKLRNQSMYDKRTVV